MTLTGARDQAAAYIEADAPRGALVRPPLRHDGISEEGLIKLARTGLPTASSSRVGKAGPALVIVTAPARHEGAAVEVRAYTLTRDPQVLDTGRGLAVVDAVEGALRRLPGPALPPLEPTTMPMVMDKSRGAYSCWRTRVLWPPSHSTAEPGAAAGAVHQVRAAAGAVAVAVLGLDPTDPVDLWRRGQSEAEVREARWLGMVPRVEVQVAIDERYRARMGASRFSDDVREYDADVAVIVLAVTASVCAATEAEADALGILLWQRLSQAHATYPGTERTLFRARDYRPAAYDEAAGCLVAHARADIQLRVPLSEPRQRAAVDGVDWCLSFDGLSDDDEPQEVMQGATSSAGA